VAGRKNAASEDAIRTADDTVPVAKLTPSAVTDDV
jgi:hypothetical protein